MKKVEPYSVEMEQALLGGILVNPDSFHRVAEVTTPEAFHDPVHRIIAGHIWGMAERGLTPSATLLGKAFPDGEMLANDMPMRRYLSQLAVNGSMATMDSAVVVQDLAARRQLLAAMREAEEVINQMPAYQPLGDVIDAVEERIYAVRDANKANATAAMHELVAQAATLAESAKTTGFVDGMRFGLRTMDAMFPPLMRQQVVGIAAPSGAGKTAMALQIMLCNTDPIEDVGEPRSHLFIQQEMSGLDVAMRVIARMGGPNVQAQLTGKFTEGQLDRIHAAADDAKLLPVWIDASGQLTMRQIRAKIKAAKRRYDIRSAWIDHLQLIRAVGKMTVLDAIRDAAMQAKDIAKENDITLGILAQLTRGAQKEMRHWRFSDQAIYGGDEFKQACDVLVGVANPAQFLIDREPAYEIRGQEHLAKVQMDIDSWRNGMEVGTLKLRSSSRVGWKRIGWDGDAQTFQDP